MGGRRELRKAQTRAEVRATAQRLFAERGFDAVTIADVAAVSQRAPGTDPVGALRRYLEQDLAHVLHQESRPENRGYVEVLENSAGLQSRERMLVELAGLRTAEGVAGAIATGSWDAAPTADPGTARVLSRLIADLFMVAGRALV